MSNKIANLEMQLKSLILRREACYNEDAYREASNYDYHIESISEEIEEMKLLMKEEK